MRIEIKSNSLRCHLNGNQERVFVCLSGGKLPLILSSFDSCSFDPVENNKNRGKIIIFRKEMSNIACFTIMQNAGALLHVAKNVPSKYFSRPVLLTVREI